MRIFIRNLIGSSLLNTLKVEVECAFRVDSHIYWLSDRKAFCAFANFVSDAEIANSLLSETEVGAKVRFYDVKCHYVILPIGTADYQEPIAQRTIRSQRPFGFRHFDKNKKIYIYTHLYAPTFSLWLLPYRQSTLTRQSQLRRSLTQSYIYTSIYICRVRVFIQLSEKVVGTGKNS